MCKRHEYMQCWVSPVASTRIFLAFNCEQTPHFTCIMYCDSLLRGNVRELSLMQRGANIGIYSSSELREFPLYMLYLDGVMYKWFGDSLVYCVVN